MKDHNKRKTGAGWIWLVNLVLLTVMETIFYSMPPVPIPEQGIPAIITLGGALTTMNLVYIVLFGLTGLILTLLGWILIRQHGASADKPAPAKSKKGKASQTPEEESNDPREQEKRIHKEKRLFLHLLSVLQKEGRLLDFLNEPLDQYEDAQIGATVRGVHENCNQALGKYLSLAPVISQAEGDPVTVAENFEADAIQLSGNVTGAPPFNGILKHKGWKAEKLRLPEFTFSGDPESISPAEIEVQ